MKKIICLIVVGLAGLAFAQVDLDGVNGAPDRNDIIDTDFEPDSGSAVAGTGTIFVDKIPVPLQEQIRQARQTASEIQTLAAQDPDAAAQRLEELRADALAKRDEMISSLPADVQARVQARIAEVEVKIEERRADLEEGLSPTGVDLDDFNKGPEK